MTKQEVFEYNKRCALFLGWKETTEQFQIDWVGCKTKERLDRLDNAYIPILEKNGDVIFSDFSVMDFTNNWNWIMEVVDAIEKSNKYKVTIGSDDWVKISTRFLHISSDFVDIVHLCSSTTKKEAVVQAIDYFLKFYNENLEMSK